MNITNINPLDWHNLRYVDYIPDHFTKLKLSTNYDRLQLLSWLAQNTTGRFAINSDISDRGDRPTFGGLSTIELSIAFEKTSDATVYGLFYK